MLVQNEEQIPWTPAALKAHVLGVPDDQRVPRN